MAPRLAVPVGVPALCLDSAWKAGAAFGQSHHRIKQIAGSTLKLAVSRRGIEVFK
jgi:hypothetical protein